MNWAPLVFLALLLVGSAAVILWEIFRDRRPKCIVCRRGRLVWVGPEELLEMGRRAGVSPERVMLATLFRDIMRCNRCGQIHERPGL